MKCRICKQSVERIEVINGHSIFACSRCSLGFFVLQNHGELRFSHLYDYDAYKKMEELISSRLERWVNKIYEINKKGKVLEIGAGYGLLSKLLSEKGDYSISIVEPELKPFYLTRVKHTHYKSYLDDFLKRNKRKYDIIIMMDVIEHLEDPFVSLNKLHGLLEKDGILVVQTPNYVSFMRHIVSDWSWWMIEDHKWFFSPKSLHMALRKSRFKLLYSATYEDWIDFKKNLDGNFTKISNSFTRKLFKGIFFSLFIPFYFLLRSVIWKMGYGGLIFSVARKN